MASHSESNALQATVAMGLPITEMNPREHLLLQGEVQLHLSQRVIKVQTQFIQSTTASKMAQAGFDKQGEKELGILFAYWWHPSINPNDLTQQLHGDIK